MSRRHLGSCPAPSVTWMMAVDLSVLCCKVLNPCDLEACQSKKCKKCEPLDPVGSFLQWYELSTPQSCPSPASSFLTAPSPTLGQSHHSACRSLHAPWSGQRELQAQPAVVAPPLILPGTPWSCPPGGWQGRGVLITRVFVQEVKIQGNARQSGAVTGAPQPSGDSCVHTSYLGQP